MRCGLIGRKLGHSYSKGIHESIGRYSYDMFEVEPEGLRALIEEKSVTGFNVTIPYKKAAMEFCGWISPEARGIGAVNTLVRGDDGVLRGYNTDCEGFMFMARRAGVEFAGKKALILGSGATSQTAAYACEALGAKSVVKVSRNGEVTYADIGLHRDADIIVNTTPVGMYPENGGKLISLDGFDRLTGVLDVVYNPLRTALVLEARARKIPCSGGLPMLAAQAVAAAGLFTGAKLPAGRADNALIDLLRVTENIVLIGMPGCGKTSVGEALAKRTGFEFIDVDRRITELAGKSIPVIFAREGERAFREMESRAIAEAGAKGGRVIATGGGAVLADANYQPLAQNGRLYFLERSIDALPCEGRPLSKDLYAMYDARLPRYLGFADARIKNDGSVAAAVDAIMREYHEYTCD